MNTTRFLHSHEAAVLLDGGSIPGWVLRDLDGLLDCCQQTVTPLPSQGGAEALGSTNQETHHHVGVLFHALPCESEGRGKGGVFITVLQISVDIDRVDSFLKNWRTIDEDGEAQEVEVSLSSAGVPTDVGVPLGEEHGARLKATAGQVGHHLGRGVPSTSHYMTTISHYITLTTSH